MKKSLFFVFSIAVISALCSGLVYAQDDKVVSAAGDMYVISAKAGGVNYIEGKVSVARKSGKSGYLLNDDQLDIGDQVTTGEDGKAEILLNPGSFVRLSNNSGFEFVSTNLDDLKLKLLKGSAILEVYADEEFKVTVGIPKSEVVLTRSGVYRIDVLADGTGKISVWKGKVFLADGVEVKSGRSALIDGTRIVSMAKFDRDNKDEFMAWSQLRAKEAAKINARLQKNALSSSLLNSFNLGRWNMFGSFGVWVFDPFTRRWCFLPFGYGWSSPWGYNYGFNLWDCRLPRYIYNQPPPVTTNPNPTGGGQVQNPTNAQRRSRLQQPTFQRFENNQRGNSDTNGGGGGWTQSDDGGANSSTKNRDSRRSDESPRSNESGDWNSPRKSEPTYEPRPTYVPPAPRNDPPVMPSSPKRDTKDN